MNQRIVIAALAALSFAAIPLPSSWAQAAPTASRSFDLSAFGGVSGVFTGLGNGKNLSVTAGGDLAFRSIFGIRPAIEVRGMYPIKSGGLDDERNVLGGVRLSRNYFRFTPYVDGLFGRGEIKYINGYFVPPQTLYFQEPSNVISGGGGVELAITDRFSVKGDVQVQRYNTLVTTTGHLYSKPLTLALVYHLNFGHFPKR